MSAPSQTKRPRQTDPIQVIIKTAVLPGLSGTADLAWRVNVEPPSSEDLVDTIDESNDGSTDSEIFYETFDESDKSITITDTHSNNCLLPGELAWVRYDEDAGSFVPIGSTGLVRQAISEEEQVPGMVTLILESSKDSTSKEDEETPETTSPEEDEETSENTIIAESENGIQRGTKLLVIYMLGSIEVEQSVHKTGCWLVVNNSPRLQFAQAPEGGLPARQGGILIETECNVLIEAPSGGNGYIEGELVKTGATITIKNYGSRVVANEGDRMIMHDGIKIVGYDCASSNEFGDFETLDDA